MALPKLFGDRLGAWSGSIAQGALAAAAFAVAALAQLPTGRLLDRFGARRVVMTIIMLQAPPLALAGQLGDRG